MTLKNSFLVSMKENNKRRLWLWLVSVLFFVILFPVFTGIAFRRTLNETAYYLESAGAVQQAIRTRLLEEGKYLLGIKNPGLWNLTAVCAVMSAIQGFSFLYHKNKIDFYMGMPVKRKKRFWVIWLNGILLFLLPFLAGTYVSALIALANGGMSGMVWKEMLTAHLLYFCLYLGVYHITLVAVMLTGNMIITCFGAAVFFLYELIIRGVLHGYMNLFFRHFTQGAFELKPIFSPFALLLTYIEKADKGQGNPFVAAFWLLLLAAVTGGIAYFCYLKRPAEAAGKALAFSAPKPYIKILLTVPITLLAGLAVGDMTSYSPYREENELGFIFISMLIVLVVISCLIQVIYEFDIRGIFHKKSHILISVAAVALIFAVFRFDLLGYDSYVPKADKVTSAAIMVNDYGYYGVYYDEDENPLDRGAYAEKYMYLTATDALCELVQISIDAEKDRKEIPSYGKAEDGEWYSAKVLFRMGKNKEVWRTVNLNVEEETTKVLLDEIMSGEEYIKGSYIGASGILDYMLEKGTAEVKANYGTEVYRQQIEKEDAQELLRRYKKDILKTGFSKMRESVPLGSLTLELSKKQGYYKSYWDTELPIYPFFTECVSYLKEKGYYMEYGFEPSDVERIQITNYHSDLAEQKRKELEEAAVQEDTVAEESTKVMPGAAARAERVYAGNDEFDFSRHVIYDDESTIQTLAGYLYPEDSVRSSFYLGKERARDFEVMVYFKADTLAAKSYGTVATYCFLEGEMPAFVEQDTAYTE